jgi:lipoyl synthase
MPKKFPQWLKRRIPCGSERTSEILSGFDLNTVCVSANCPNRGECFSKSEATFMILGSVCSRSCRFCSVKKGIPLPIDDNEPDRIVQAIKKMNLKFVVITSVTRDDLDDAGAAHFAKTVKTLRQNFGKKIGIELLIPDLNGNRDALKIILNEDIDVLNHNVETVERLYSSVRSQADYKRSLFLIRDVKKIKTGIFTKSGLMLGLGEKEEEVKDAISDIRKMDCDFLTLGQYLKPDRLAIEISEFVAPEKFEEYKEFALKLGFKNVASGPFVRSSYNAGSFFKDSQ